MLGLQKMTNRVMLCLLGSVGPVCLSLLLTGCVHALRPYNEPSQQKLHIQSSIPQQYAVRIAEGSEYHVPSDGRVAVDVPRLERGCATYLFGVIKVKDSSPYDLPAIQLSKDGRTVKKLSLNDLTMLPVDERGYRIVTVD